jgi:quinoprotein glucose dehydrogenase
LTALDLRSGEILWQIPLGQSKKFGITVPAFLGWGSPNIGGPLLTGGGVIFIGATLDAKLRAIDASSGRELWQAALPAPAMSVPITYMADGRQFVITTAGGHYLADTEISDAVVAFALPR